MKIIREYYFNKIDSWWSQTNNEALLVTGPLSVGKTTLILDWVKNKKISYKYFNEEKYNIIKCYFSKANNPYWNFSVSILDALHLKGPLPKLLIFDGVKPGDELIVQLKYLCANTNFKIILITDYGEYVFNNIRFIPVGSIQKIEVFPLSFKEFCKLTISDYLIRTVTDVLALNGKQDIPLIDKFEDLWNQYSHFGGLPSVVSALLEKGQAVAEAELFKIKNSITSFINNSFPTSSKILTLLNNFSSSRSSSYHRIVFSSVYKTASYTRLKQEISILKELGFINEVSFKRKDETATGIVSLYFYDVGLEYIWNKNIKRDYALEAIMTSFIASKSYSPFRIILDKNLIIDFSWESKKTSLFDLYTKYNQSIRHSIDKKAKSSLSNKNILFISLIDKGLTFTYKKENLLICPVWLYLLGGN